MGSPPCTAVFLLFLLQIAAQGGRAEASLLSKTLEDTLQSQSNVKEEMEVNVGVDTHDWDEEFDGTPTLRILTDDNFEHDTQAATGQTTGIWLVLFWTHNSATSRSAEDTLLQVYTQTKGSQLLIAGVNVKSNPRTVKRFDIRKVPVLVLLRDRRMYTYKGHWAVMNIIKFVKDGYKDVVAETVPKEITIFDELLEMPLLYYHATITYLANRPGMLAGVGSTLAMCGYLKTKRWLLKRSLGSTAQARPRKRVD